MLAGDLAADSIHTLLSVLTRIKQRNCTNCLIFIKFSISYTVEFVNYSYLVIYSLHLPGTGKWGGGGGRGVAFHYLHSSELPQVNIVRYMANLIVVARQL